MDGYVHYVHRLVHVDESVMSVLDKERLTTTTMRNADRLRKGMMVVLESHKRIVHAWVLWVRGAEVGFGVYGYVRTLTPEQTAR